MSKKIKWGILGAGAIGSTFAKNLKSSRTGELHAVASRSIDKANKFGDEFGAPVRHGSYEALLADPSVDAVYVCTPHTFHAEWAIKSANAGKHILVEKPFALNQWEATAILEAATLNKVFAMEAFMYRCHPQTAKLVEIIKSGVIGEVRLIQATFGFQAGFNAESRLYNNDLAGGGIMDVGCYTVSMARLIAGAAVGKDFADPTEVKGSAHLGTTGVDEWAVATLKFPSVSSEGKAPGIVAQLATAVGQNMENVVRIFGSNGKIFLSNPWVANRGAAENTTIVVNVNGEKDAREIKVEAAVTSFTLEADFAGDAILAGKQQAAAPAHTWDDVMSQMRTVDRWRDAIGLKYDVELPVKFPTLTVARIPLVFNSRPRIPHGKIPGVNKPVSRLVLGCDNQLTLPQFAVIADDFFELGGNTFDTSFIYGGGTQERLLGQWMKSRGIREQVVTIAKGLHTPDTYPARLAHELPETLRRFQTDYTDLYVMHRDNPQVPVGEFVSVINDHIKAGRIKAWGGSNWTLARIDEAKEYAKKNGLVGPIAVSNNFSLARMVNPVWPGCISASDPDSRRWLEATQTVLLPWSSQARGFFVPGRAAPDILHDQELVKPWYSDDNFQRQARAFELAKKYNVEPISIALAYVLAQPFPTFPLIGPRQLSETRTSLPGLDLKLTPHEVKWLNLEA